MDSLGLKHFTLKFLSINFIVKFIFNLLITLLKECKLQTKLLFTIVADYSEKTVAWHL